MDDPRTADGIEHLQAAARELVAAARSFLDVVEQVVDDDDRFSGAASSIAELVGRGVGSATAKDLAGGLLGGLAGREPAWLRNDPDHPDAPDEPFVRPAPEPTTGPPGADTSPTPAPVDTAPVDIAPVKKAPVKKAPTRTAPVDGAPAAAAPVERAARSTTPTGSRTRRVKRIAVD